ncbi:XRE family transcriptional regulator [Ruminococcus sp. AF18-22]|nr:XRE family transcriptional regulator [Ruminococcus sp. AF18-22]
MENRTGQFIARRRKAIGLTQKELAEQLGVTNKAVSKWETGGGMPDVSVLKELSRILEVSVDELLDGEYTDHAGSEKTVRLQRRARDRKNKEQDVLKETAGTTGQDVKAERESYRGRFFLGALALLPAIAVLCMQILFLYVRRNYQIEYITEWLPWLFFSVAVLSVTGALCICLQKRLARFICAGMGAGVLLLFLVLGIYAAVKPYALRTIVSVSPDHRHMAVLKYEKETGRVLTYQNQKLWFARRSDPFPYTAEEDMKMQWLADDVCAVTYKSPDDGQVHQYVLTYGDRGDGITTYYVYNVVQGGWSAEGKNTAGWELKTGPEGITVVSSSEGEETYAFDECVQFGTLAIALCKGGLPQWTLALEEDCQIADIDYIEAGTVALCKVTMEKSAPVHFTRGELPDREWMEKSAAEDAQELGKVLAKEMKEVLKADPTLAEYESTVYGGIRIETEETDIFWIVRCAMEERLKIFSANGGDVDCQILHMELTAGDSYDCVVQVKSRETYTGSAGEDSQADMETTFRVMKGEGVYLLCPVGYGTDAAAGLDPPAMRQERDTKEDEKYHFFVPAQ